MQTARLIEETASAITVQSERQRHVEAGMYACALLLSIAK
jgi:hypothetical protein